MGAWPSLGLSHFPVFFMQMSQLKSYFIKQGASLEGPLNLNSNGMLYWLSDLGEVLYLSEPHLI